jgi:hypothetical protein
MTLSVNAKAVAQDALPNLFAPSTIQPRSGVYTGPEVIRWRSVEIDFSLLQDASSIGSQPDGREQPTFVFNLFEDVFYQATIETTQELANGSVGMIGRVNSTEINEFVLVSGEGILQAYIQDGPRYYEVRFDGSGHLIVEVDPNLYPESLAPEVLPRDGSGQVMRGDGNRADLPQADSADQIDVLAIYTPAARSAVGGTAAMEAKIQASILSANQGYTASAVNQQVQLVGMEEVNYSESVPGVTDPLELWYYALYRLTFGYYYVSDPVDANYLADARAFREAYGADLVFMVTALPSNYCGLGWLAGNPSQENVGYSLVHYNCTGSTAYTVQHEMGHNMGACHDRANNSSSGCYDQAYSYGYQQPNQFYTVMAYASGCGPNCFRLNRWSNPNLTYNGFPTGVPLNQPNSAFNTLTLNNTAINVANYRQSVSPITGSFISPAPGSYSMIPRTYLDVNASSSVGSIVRVTYSVNYDGGWHTVFNDTNGADGWTNLWSTHNISEQLIDIEAEIEDSLGNTDVIQLQDIPLTRSHTISGIFTSRQGGTAQEEAEGSTSMEQSTLEEQEAAPKEPRAYNSSRRHINFTSRKRWMLL